MKENENVFNISSTNVNDQFSAFLQPQTSSFQSRLQRFKLPNNSQKLQSFFSFFRMTKKWQIHRLTGLTAAGLIRIHLEKEINTRKVLKKSVKWAALRTEWTAGNYSLIVNEICANSNSINFTSFFRPIISLLRNSIVKICLLI